MMTREEARAAFEKYMVDPPRRRTSVLLKLHDLIHIAFGDLDENPVNFKIVEIILTIFGRQMNILEQDINILDPLTETEQAERQMEYELEQKQIHAHAQAQTEAQTSAQTGAQTEALSQVQGQTEAVMQGQAQLQTQSPMQAGMQDQTQFQTQGSMPADMQGQAQFQTQGPVLAAMQDQTQGQMQVGMQDQAQLQIQGQMQGQTQTQSPMQAGMRDQEQFQTQSPTQAGMKGQDQLQSQGPMQAGMKGQDQLQSQGPMQAQDQLLIQGSMKTDMQAEAQLQPQGQKQTVMQGQDQQQITVTEIIVQTQVQTVVETRVEIQDRSQQEQDQTFIQAQGQDQSFTQDPTLTQRQAETQVQQGQAFTQAPAQSQDQTFTQGPALTEEQSHARAQAITQVQAQGQGLTLTQDQVQSEGQAQAYTEDQDHEQMLTQAQADRQGQAKGIAKSKRKPQAQADQSQQDTRASPKKKRSPKTQAGSDVESELEDEEILEPELEAEAKHARERGVGPVSSSAPVSASAPAYDIESAPASAPTTATAGQRQAEPGKESKKSTTLRAPVSVDVMTRSQFELLAARVRSLAAATAPVPLPSMPDNAALRSGISAGSASLPDAMGAMQLNARVLAAEAALARMTGILAKLADAGVFSPAMFALIRQIAADLKDLGFDMGNIVIPDGPSAQSASTATATRAAEVLITHRDLNGGVERARHRVAEAGAALAHAAAAAEQRAAAKAHAIVDLKERAEKLSSRLDSIQTVAGDYSTQLSRFDCGLASQLKSFNEQLMDMQFSLKEGLKVIDALQNDSETAAVRELRARHSVAVELLRAAAAAHRAAADTERDLSEQIKDLIEWVELLGEQKVDCDEVNDALRDKADMKRIKGLLREELFLSIQATQRARLALCADKFRKQDAAWQTVTQEMSQMLRDKAEDASLTALAALVRDDMLAARQRMWALAHYLVNEPKTALLARMLRNPREQSSLPAAAPPPPPPSPPAPPASTPRFPLPLPRVPCERDDTDTAAPDIREHACARWTGGSHTLLRGVESVPAPHARLQRTTLPYRDYAPDGTGPYHLERQCVPCEQCNEPPTTSASAPTDAENNPRIAVKLNSLSVDKVFNV